MNQRALAMALKLLTGYKSGQNQMICEVGVPVIFEFNKKNQISDEVLEILNLSTKVEGEGTKYFEEFNSSGNPNYHD